MSWFMDIQEVIRKHVGEHIKEPFVKVLMSFKFLILCRHCGQVEPSEGQATIWCKGAQEKSLELGCTLPPAHTAYGITLPLLQDAMKLASLMQKSYFMGRKAWMILVATAASRIPSVVVMCSRKTCDCFPVDAELCLAWWCCLLEVVASLCRKAKPVSELLPRVPRQRFSFCEYAICYSAFCDSLAGFDA